MQPPSSSATYYVTVANSNNCSNTDSVRVDIISAAQFTASSVQAICENSVVQLNASGGNIYNWSPPASLNNPAIANPVAFPLISTVYSVTITESTCNESAVLSVPVTVYPLSGITVAKSNDIDCIVGFAQLNAGGGQTYSWSPATGLDNPNSASPIANPVITTIYSVTGTDASGCSNTDSVIVIVDHSGNYGSFLMPTAFTPNNDGLNDCFGIKFWGSVIEFEMHIFNRWGEQVFQTTNPAACWNGKYKGIEQKTDVFVYWVKAKTTCEPSVFRKGIVTLIR